MLAEIFMILKQNTEILIPPVPFSMVFINYLFKIHMVHMGHFQNVCKVSGLLDKRIINGKECNILDLILVPNKLSLFKPFFGKTHLRKSWKWRNSVSWVKHL